MKKIIKLTESDLINIVKRVLEEQPDEKFDTPYNKELMRKANKPITNYTCVPDKIDSFVNYVLANKNELMKKLKLDYKDLILLTKASIGIMGRETDFGNFSTSTDNASEILRGIGLSSLVNWYLQRNYGKNASQSLGYAQFTPQTWKRYDLDKIVGDYNLSFNAISQGLGTLYGLNLRYQKALSNGLKPQPSVNAILAKYGLTPNGIKGTGNHALDMAIMSHNMPEEKTIYPYCTTNHPLYAAPCYKTKHKPFDSEKSTNFTDSKLLKSVSDPNLKKFPGELIVNKSSVIPNFIPNLGGKHHSGIGYVEEVATYIRKTNCF